MYMIISKKIIASGCVIVGNQCLNTDYIFKCVSSPIPVLEKKYVFIKYKKIVMDIVLLLLLCTVNGVHTIFQHVFIYSNTSLFRKMEIIPKKFEFNRFLLRTIIFLLTFYYLAHPYSNTLSLYFHTENTRANIFFSWKKSTQKLLTDKFHKISKQSPCEI